MTEPSDPRKQTFELIFGDAPEIKAQGHARVNLIGEHTDYNGGFVLPLLMPHRTAVQLKKRNDRRVRDRLAI
jgi:galactokinase